MKKFHESRFDNNSAITDAMKAKGEIYYAILQGYIIFETDLTPSKLVCSRGIQCYRDRLRQTCIISALAVHQPICIEKKRLRANGHWLKPCLDKALSG